METSNASLKIRAKIIGALIRDARLRSGKRIEECAQAIGVSNQTFEGYELGNMPISLPELEGVAYHLDIPLDHFWGGTALPTEDDQRKLANFHQLIQVRQRMVGALLRQARQELELSMVELAKRMGWDVSLLESYELGREPIPFPQLEVLCSVLNRSIREFLDSHGPVGTWNAQQQALKDFQSLPLELQMFVSKPVNRPYIELAVRLSEMSADRLRAVAEGLLDITY